MSHPKLHSFQEQGASWLKERNRSILADEPGLGKTAQSILGRMHNSVNIICPATIKGNWVNEIKIWSNLNPIISNGIGSFRWANDGEAVISNPDILQGWSDPPLNKITLIIDEAHTYRNNGSQKFANAKSTFSQLSAEDQIISMTGTPIVNRLTDLANLLEITGLLNDFGGRNGLAESLGGTAGKRGDLNNCEVNKWFTDKLGKVMLRREKAQVLDNLPKKHYEVLLINEWSGELNTIMNDGLSSLEAYEKINGEIQPGSLPNIGQLSAARKAIAIEKTEHAKPLVKKFMDLDKQVILFSAHKAPVDEFSKWDGWKKIDGSVTNKKRQINTEEFLAKELKGIALTIGAGSCGWNGYSSNRMIFIDLSYALSDNLQAEDRIHRIGSQHNDVYYTYLTFDHALDRRIGQICTGKKKLFDSVMDPVSNSN